MRRLRDNILLTLLWSMALLLCCGTDAQAADASVFKFKHLTTADGLTGSMVTCFAKDSRGYVWIGTSSGLNRYDGYRLRAYTAVNGDVNTLPDSYIRDIQEDADGKLWLRTSGGYVVMDPAKRTFDRSMAQRLIDMGIAPGNDVENIIVYIDKNKNMWFAVPGEGLCYYKRKLKLQYKFPFTDRKSGLPMGTVTSISDNGDGGVIVSYRDGTVAKVNGETHRVEALYNDVSRMPGMPQGTFRTFVDSRRNVWVYTPMEFLLRFNETGEWVRGLPQILKRLGWEEDFAHDVVAGMAEDGNGLLWLATARSGLIAIDVPHMTVLAHLTNDPQDSRSLAGDNLQSVYVDSEGQLWVGTSRRGVSRWYPSFYLFGGRQGYDVNGLSFGSDGTLWLATQKRGLVRVGRDGNMEEYKGLLDVSIRSVLAARDGTVWAGSGHYGLSHVMTDGTVYNYEPETGVKDRLQNGGIEALAQDGRGNIWIGTNGGGLQCFSPQSGKFSLFNTAGDRLPSNFVTSLCIRDNRLIVGTTAGIVDMNLSNNQSTVITGTRNGEKRFASNTVTQVLLDSRGLIWVGTRDGLSIYNSATDRMITVTRGSNLVNNVIHGLAEDGNGNVWISTARGLNRMALAEDPTATIGYNLLPTFYTTSDGLYSSEFNLGAITTSQQGRVYMGSAMGYNFRLSSASRMTQRLGEADSLLLPHFDTSKRKENPVRVIFTGLHAGGGEVKVGERSRGTLMLTDDIDRVESISLPFHRRQFSIDLAVSSLTLARHPQFLYRIVGKNDRWLPADAVEHRLSVMWLRPGHYRLEVKAVADGSIVLTDVRTLDIEVSFPLWLKWWAILIYLAIVGAGFWWVRRQLPRMRRFVQRRREAVRRLEEKEHTVDQLAQGLRTQVAGMVPVISRLYESVADEDGMEHLSTLQHTTKSMLAQLNEMRIGVAAYVDQQEADILVDDDTEVEIDPATYRAAMKQQYVSEASGKATFGNAQTTVRSNKRSVLIVEPDKDMAEFIDDCLKSSFDLRTCTTLEAASEAIALQRPDVVVLSHEMPDDAEAGSRMCENIKNDRTTQNVQVVMATEKVMVAAEMQHLHLTLVADDYVPKPFNLQTLAWRIGVLCGDPADVARPVDDTMDGAEAMCAAAADLLRQQVDGYVLQNISRTDLSIDEMSRVLGVPRAQLFRRVQRITGMAPADYIRHLRLVEAAKLLAGGYLSAAEVSSALGFPNLTMFTRFFKDEYGVPPSSYHGNA